VFCVSVPLSGEEHRSQQWLASLYSYNRYCFNDDNLPNWFQDDEKKNFRPQLPVDKDVVDRIRAQFRDIAARPIKKVAEARARKKMRMAKKLDKVKQAAESIMDSTEVSDKSKSKALERAYRKGLREEKTKKTLIVHACVCRCGLSAVGAVRIVVVGDVTAGMVARWVRLARAGEWSTLILV
jgi:AdoMet-dependent rRNA methyltransferase SPB1